MAFEIEEMGVMKESIQDRSDQRSTLVVSQLPLEHWHGAFGDPSVVDAILDRLVHHAHKIILKGESMRKVLGDQQPTDHQEKA